jgi:hypothetical protein
MYSMVTLFTSSHGTFVTPSVKILLLRDNVQHHLQLGRPDAGYPWIHEIADGSAGLTVARPPACELWSELSVAFAGIREIAVRDTAMSIRTRSILSGLPGVPAVRGTILMRRAGWATPIPLGGARTLGELFTDILCGFQRITLEGNGSGKVDVSGGLTQGCELDGSERTP